MLVVHANWTNGGLHLWAESFEAWYQGSNDEQSRNTRASDEGTAAVALAAPCDTRAAIAPPVHPFAVASAELVDQLGAAGVAMPSYRPSNITLRLPGDDDQPWPSEQLAVAVGAVDRGTAPMLRPWSLPSVAPSTDGSLDAILAIERAHRLNGLEIAHSVRFWSDVARFVLDLLADQRFIPTVFRVRGDDLRAAWQPWLHDDEARRRVGSLLSAMPPVVRAAVDEHDGRAWALLDEALRTVTDAAVRRALAAEQFEEAIEGRDASADPHVAWLAGLLGASDRVVPADGAGTDMLRDASRWVSRLDETGHDQPLRLCLRLDEPDVVPDDNAQDAEWTLRLALQSDDDSDDVIEASDIWTGTGATRHNGLRRERLQELLLSELDRASLVYPLIERVLAEAAPSVITLSTVEAYEFLSESRPVLEESGIAVAVPEWWHRPAGTLGARLQIEAPELEAAPAAPSAGVASGRNLLGLNSLVEYRWQIAVGDQPLSMEEFESLARHRAPLVRLRDRWVELRGDQMKAATEFITARPQGQMRLFDAIQVAFGADSTQFGLPIFGLDATGWVKELLGASDDQAALPSYGQPAGFIGSLRPYQLSGLNWLTFLDRFGLGACLADDMGLGKTIQLIALLLLEREQAAPDEKIGRTLLIVPTSLVGNWTREISRFAPTLKSTVHHGPHRPVGDEFLEAIEETDVVITTYGLVTRDVETLDRVHWHRLALDEAQYIKNPPTKQTSAIRSLAADRRLALTGTPVENRLTELWSIMQFCNPGYLGSSADFRRRFAVPIERHRDDAQAERLRQLVRPFILRRLKTDSRVIDDLPECVQTREYATLTPEQAALYETVVNSMLGQVDRADGMQRRGLVLSTLVKLKQVCNHPAQFLDEGAKGRTPSAPVMSNRSGKVKRLIAMLEEVLATDERALIFTQFRQMGHLLQAMLKHDLDVNTLFLHGGTPQNRRQQMIDRFQDPDGDVPIFVLSLKAGGVGLNLTAANHVFHLDRWWNPAVENQATDRAFRIGQHRTVHVHKFVCVGTLEERIDAMIEQKTQLADNIIGAGEGWLTEMSTQQLHEVLTLRETAMDTDG